VSERLLLSVKRDVPTFGKWMAVITCGGHPQFDPDQPCVVLDANVFDTPEECNEWFRRMQIERPWETRQ